MFKVIPLYLAALILFSACASTGAAARNDASDREAAAQEAAASAMDALAIMDGGSPRSSASSSRQNTAAPAGASQAAAGGRTSAPPAQTTQTQSPAAARTKPAWVDAPDAVYSKEFYISVVGYGPDRNQAERDALGKLTGYFGQTIQADLKTISSYSEAVKSGAIQVEENTSVQNAISTSAEMDTLVGAEIADVWFDNQRTYYAAAVMEKEKTSILYADLIHSNERIIGDLVNMDARMKNSLDGYSRYLLAGTIADANRVYANVLTIVGDTRGIDPAAMKKGDDYRVEAAGVAKNIPIGVSVEGDRGNRIKTAFSKAISGAGFRSGGTNSRYVLKASYAVTEVEFPNQPNKFVRYQINGGLEDTAEGGSVLVPFDASGREGHLSLANAEERALQTAEKKIAAEFETALKEYLSSLLPK